MLVQIDIEPLLLEGSRRQDEWQRIMAVLPNDRMIVAINPRSSSQPSRAFTRWLIHWTRS
jgi:hypothetical protein